MKSQRQACDILKSLPPPEYKVNFQPEYPDNAHLEEVIHELIETTPVTNERNVHALSDQLARIATGIDKRKIIITGNCAEPVEVDQPVESLVDRVILHHEIAHAALGNILYIHRGMGQNTKPRSNPFQVLEDGTVLVSYQGDAVNGKGHDQRTPDPSRMVAAAVQARDLSVGVEQRLGNHQPVAHEALLLPYEEAFVRLSTQEQRRVLLSADLPWIGLRTNDPDGAHVQLLSDVINPVGVKIGSNSNESHIKELHERLNPRGIPGHLIFMLRLDAGQSNEEILSAIREHAPGALSMFDIHAVTRTNASGSRIRSTEETIHQMNELAVRCGSLGLKLHGVHLETTTEDRFECVDQPNQEPLHNGNVDPQLNPEQTKRVLRAINTGHLWQRSTICVTHS